MLARRSYYLFFSLLVIASLSCTKNSDGETDYTPLLSLDKQTIILSGLAQAKDSFAVASTIGWDISVAPVTATWLSLSAQNGQANRKVLVRSVEGNTTGGSRTATGTITPDAASSLPTVTVTVIQRPATHTDSTASLVGRWRYIRDSSTNIGSYYFNSGGFWVPIAGTYWGTPQDYWEFRVDGSTQFHGNGNTHSDHYQLHPNNRLGFSILMSNTMAHLDTMAHIVTLTAEELIFYFDDTSPNGGRFHRRVFLKR